MVPEKGRKTAVVRWW